MEELETQEQLEMGNGQQIEDEYLSVPEKNLISDRDPEKESIDVPKRRIRFNLTVGSMPLKDVVETDAHLSGHGKTKLNFIDALNMVIDTAHPVFLLEFVNQRGKF